MSLARVHSFAFAGIEAVPVEVQVQVSSGLPAFLVVGLPDKAVGEARERVRAALTAMGLALPPRRVLINLAPADLLKEGSHFDLPIALCVLAAMDVLPREELGGYAALGELSLDGTLNPVAGVLPAAIGASSRGLGLICPAAQGGEAAWAGDIEVLALPDLLCAVNHFRGTQVLTPPAPGGIATAAGGPDLTEVKGMQVARRALEIAAAGSHNLLLIGPPGAGKSMLASRLPGLLPDLTPREALDVSMIHSVAGLLEGGRLVTRPPYREPHHSASQAALSGGGQRARPGEVSLAHRGVLFLDELPEFARAALEALRQPLEAGHTTVARAAAHITYPARFQLVAAMNPCRCGHLGDASRECGKAPRCGEDYLNRISGPLLDRIDMTVQVQPVSPTELSRAPAGEASGPVAARVADARAIQRGRGGLNAEADAAALALQPEARGLAERAAERLRLSARGFTRVLRVARTVADLARSPDIRRVDVAEALAFRHRIPGRVAMLAGFLGLAGAAHAEPLQVEIGHVGEVVARHTERALPPTGNNLAGVAAVTTPVYTREGSEISGTFCQQFGMDYRATNLAAGETAAVLVRIDHPLWIRPDGRTGTIETWTSVLQGSQWSYSGYTLEEPWSLVAGTWTFSVIQGTRTLASQSFQVSVAPGQSFPSEGCIVPVS